MGERVLVLKQQDSLSIQMGKLRREDIQGESEISTLDNQILD